MQRLQTLDFYPQVISIRWWIYLIAAVLLLCVSAPVMFVVAVAFAAMYRSGSSRQRVLPG